MPVAIETVKEQVGLVLAAWGIKPDHVAACVEVMGYADLHGIDSHGCSMLTVYDNWRRQGMLTMDATVSVVKETPVSALLDGGGGLGYYPSVTAMGMAIAKARAQGIAAAGVRNSAHFGAAGYYTRMAALAGMVGFSCTSGSGSYTVPTFGAEPKYSTDPLSFAAPGAEGPPFVLDMATTTVARGRIRNRANEGVPLPTGWATDRQGVPTTDAAIGADGFQLPLGGTPEGASHKGYGLAAMVNILASCMTGASLVTSEGHTRRTPGTMDIGHFFFAIDPALFRPPGAFQADLDSFTGSLRATRPVDPARPVMVAGDPERQHAEKRIVSGIPVGAGLAARIRTIAEAASVPFLLQDALGNH